MDALKQSIGLKRLSFKSKYKGAFSNEDWGSMYQSLTRRPSLEIPLLWAVGSDEDIKTFRTQCLLNMVKIDKVIQYIDVFNAHCEVDGQLFALEIEPRLEINRHWHILQAAATTPDESRKQEAVEAMSAVYNNTSFLWMLVVDNVDVLLY